MKPLYRLLLRLFPPDMRADFGAEMEELVAEHYRRTRGVGRVQLWVALLADAIRHGLGARFDRRAQGNESKPRLLMDMLSHDLRYALRTLFKQPSVTAMMLTTLALGIGANTAVFSVINAVLLRSLPYPEPDQLVVLNEKRPAEGSINPVSAADYLDWADLNQSFAHIAGYSEGTVDLTGVGDPVQVPTAAVTADFFNVFAVTPLYGRVFATGDDVLGQHRVVVLSHALWQQRFGAESTVIGRTITVNRLPQQVIGVLPSDFEWPVGAVQLWAPLVLRGGSEAPSRTNHFLNVYARLKQGVTYDAARAEMDAIGRRLEEQYPALSRGHGSTVAILRDELVKPVRRGLVVLAVAVGFVLLIACTNVANLLIARGATRRRELAIRAAVGAARSRLLRQALTESVVLAVVSGLLGLGFAYGLLQLLIAQTPPALRGVGLDRATLDASVLAFTLAICVATGLIAGLLPAWLVARSDLADPLRESGRAPSGLRKGIRFALVVAEVSLTSLLLVGAGLMLRSFERVLSQPAGFTTESRLTVPLVLPRSRYADQDSVRRARQEFEAQLAGIPGVLAAGANNNLPLTGSDSRQGITVEGLERRAGDAPVRAHLRIVTTQYFKAMDIRLAAGRGFSDGDNAMSPLVVVINETMAKRYWPNQSAVGKRMRFNDANATWREVIGVVKDVRHWGLDREVNPELYMPHQQQPSSTLHFVLHTVVPPATIGAEVTRRVHEVDPDLALGPLRTMEEVAGRSVAARRWSAVLLGSFGVLALVLAAVGIYGVMTQLVASRVSEIGIRLTLGAKPSAVLWQVLREGLLHSSLGLSLGLLVSIGVMRGLQALLFEVRASDPLTLVLVAATLLVVAAVACWAPARRAMRIDPVEALRIQ